MLLNPAFKNRALAALAGVSFWVAAVQMAPAQSISTTLQDYFLAGTQPTTLSETLISAQDCAGCHGGYGEDDAPFETWETSMKAQAARDPLFHACLAVAEQDAGFVGDSCIRCHAPLGWVDGRSTPTDGSALAFSDFEGVSCSLCHRMVDPVYDAGVSPPEDQAILVPGLLGGMIPTKPHTGQYVLDPQDRRRGPFDLDPFFFHSWLESPFHQESLLCSTCHDVSNPIFDRVGGVTPAPTDTYSLNTLNQVHFNQSKFDMFPVERTYSEWSESDFADGPIDMGGRFGGNIVAVSTCQDCHLPNTTAKACGLNPPTRTDMPTHRFEGANTWVFQAVRNLDATNELYGPFEESGLTQQQVDDAIARNIDFLERAADLTVTAAGNQLTVRVVNQTGHKLPTGYPEGRRMWLNVRFFNGVGALIAERGNYDGATATLTTGDTTVYEGKLGMDAAIAALSGNTPGESFHFALNNVWIKDNRIPPRGFTNAGFASVQASPFGTSYADGEYWDDTNYTIPCAAESASVVLYYQTTSKEYIEFLQSENTTNNRGTIAYNQWVATGRSAPVAMATSNVNLPACTNRSTGGRPRFATIALNGGEAGLMASGLTPHGRAIFLDVTSSPGPGSRHRGGIPQSIVMARTMANEHGDAVLRVPEGLHVAQGTWLVQVVDVASGEVSEPVHVSRGGLVVH